MSDREEFEEAASRLGYNLTMAEHETGEYNYRVTQDAWDIWQEAKEQAARAQEGGEAVESLQYIRECRYGHTFPCNPCCQDFGYCSTKKIAATPQPANKQ